MLYQSVLHINCIKMHSAAELRPDSLGSLQCSPYPKLDLGGLLLKEGKGLDGREGEGTGIERMKGKGR